MSFPDTLQLAAALRSDGADAAVRAAAATRLEALDQLTRTQEANVEALRGRASDRDGQAARVVTLEAELASALSRVDDLEGDWAAALRVELAGEPYAALVAAEDAAGLWALLAKPDAAVTYPDPIPTAALLGDLAEIAATLALAPGIPSEVAARWDRLIERWTAMLAGVSLVPRRNVLPLASAAKAAGLVAADWQPGSVELSRLDVLGLPEVRGPKQVQQAMGW